MSGPSGQHGGQRTELDDAADWFHEFRARAAECTDLDEVRMLLTHMIDKRGDRLEPDVQFRSTTIGGVHVDHGRASTTDPNAVTVLHFHGGGFTIGKADDSRLLLSRIASALRAQTVSVDYRLAPEHPWPAAVADGVAVYEALLDNGTPANALVLSGESAGGGLAVLVAREARRRGLPGPAAMALQSPLVDFTASEPSYEFNASADIVTSRASILRSVELFLDGADASSASPVRGDLAGLPPTLLQVGDREVLRGDAETFARTLRAAGVPVTEEIWLDVPHTWHGFATLTAARRATDRIVAFVSEQLPFRIHAEPSVPHRDAPHPSEETTVLPC